MGLKNREPQVLIYWLQLVLALPCTGLVGNHANYGPLRFCVAATALFGVLTLLFLVMYSMRKCRPPVGRSYFKLIEAVFQGIAVFMYVVVLGIYSREYYVDRSFGEINAAQIFCSANFAAYLFGMLLAVSAIVWETPAEYERKRKAAASAHTDAVEVTGHPAAR